MTKDGTMHENRDEVQVSYYYTGMALIHINIYLHTLHHYIHITLYTTLYISTLVLHTHYFNHLMYIES